MEPEPTPAETPNVVDGNFSDKTLKCKDCGKDWLFVAGEQQFYSEKGFENEPTRCKECRKTLKDAKRRRSRLNKNKKDNGPKICYAFRDGNCERGEECIFAHILPGDMPETCPPVTATTTTAVEDA